MLVQLSSPDETEQSPEILSVSFVLVLPKGKLLRLEAMLLNFTNQTFFFFLKKLLTRAVKAR